MGAIVVGGGLSSSNWVRSKPSDYKGQDLDRALKSFEAVANKMPSIPSNLIPKAPKATIGEIDTCITGLESAVTELQKALALVKQIATALESVQGASGKAAADLRKLAKGKDADKDAYDNAASVAESIGGTAGTALNTIK